MGDGSLAFAPQWLKASQTNLRSGTQGGASSSKEKSSEASSWRESGSRLGLGAGTDRDFPDSKLSGSRKRSSGAFTDRTSDRGEKSLGLRSLNQGRQLSDRELVEQTSSLKLRSGRDDSFASFNTSRQSKGLSRRNGVQGSLRNGRSQDKDYGSFGRVQNTSHQLSSILLSPRQEMRLASGSAPITVPAAELGEWTTRLADTPHEVPKASPSFASNSATDNHASDNSETGTQSLPGTPAASIRGNSSPMRGALFPQSALGKSLAGTLDADNLNKSLPRMADAIANAQANAAQELESAKLEKLRREHLVLRQSTKLVPVLPSSKPKQTSSSGATMLKKSLALDGPKPNATAFITTSRKEEDRRNIKPAAGLLKSGIKTNDLDISSKPLHDQDTVEKSLSSRPSKEKDRLSFFSSLKSKSSASETRPDSDVSSQLSQDIGTAKTEQIPIETRYSSEIVKEEAPSLQYTSASEDIQADLTDKEYAFMKSLGWEDEPSDEGGLTEEEIAAFYASTARMQIKSLNIPSSKKNAGFKSITKSKNPKQQLSRSFHSELEFSDTDSD